jgi:hypothetical protein
MPLNQVEIVNEELGKTAKVHPNAVGVWVAKGWKLVKEEAEKFEAEVEALAEGIEGETGSDPETAKAEAQALTEKTVEPAKVTSSPPAQAAAAPGTKPASTPAPTPEA